jgi:hypothetical protein
MSKDYYDCICNEDNTCFLWGKYRYFSPCGPSDFVLEPKNKVTAREDLQWAGWQIVTSPPATSKPALWFRFANEQQAAAFIPFVPTSCTRGEHSFRREKTKGHRVHNAQWMDFSPLFGLLAIHNHGDVMELQKSRHSQPTTVITSQVVNSRAYTGPWEPAGGGAAASASVLNKTTNVKRRKFHICNCSDIYVSTERPKHLGNLKGTLLR